MKKAVWLSTGFYHGFLHLKHWLLLSMGSSVTLFQVEGWDAGFRCFTHVRQQVNINNAGWKASILKIEENLSGGCTVIIKCSCRCVMPTMPFFAFSLPVSWDGCCTARSVNSGYRRHAGDLLMSQQLESARCRFWRCRFQDAAWWCLW